MVLVQFIVLATTYCDNERESNEIPDEERVLLILVNYRHRKQKQNNFSAVAFYANLKQSDIKK